MRTPLLVLLLAATAAHAEPTADPTKACTDHRTFLVLAKAPAGWRIVHQHDSEHIIE